MNKNISLLLLLLTTALSACGGGGGGGGGQSSPAPTTALVRISTEGVPSNSAINGVEATLQLPQGVSVKTNVDPPQTDPGVVVSAGADLVMGVYSSASGTVSVSVIRTAGIAVGEFATVTCNITPGIRPSDADFSVSGLDARDPEGRIITGLTATFSVTMQ